MTASKNATKRMALVATGLAAATAAVGALVWSASAEPTTYDVGGLLLGMNHDEATAALQVHRDSVEFRGIGTNLDYKIELPQMEPFSGLRLSGVTGNTAAMIAPTRNQDLIAMLASPEDEVVSIFRSIGFEPGEGPSVEALRSSIVEKYGDPLEQTLLGDANVWGWTGLGAENLQPCVMAAGAYPLGPFADELVRMSRDFVGGAPRPLGDMTRDAYVEMFDLSNVPADCERVFVAVAFSDDGSSVKSAHFISTDYGVMRAHAASITDAAAEAADLASRPAMPRL